MGDAMPALRTLRSMLGRVVALGAISYGLVIGVNAMARSREDWATWLIVLAGVLSVCGGVSYLAGLDRMTGRRARMARVGGWGLFTAGFLLPSSLQFLLLAGSVLALPAAVASSEVSAGPGSDPPRHAAG